MRPMSMPSPPRDSLVILYTFVPRPSWSLRPCSLLRYQKSRMLCFETMLDPSWFQLQRTVVIPPVLVRSEVREPPYRVGDLEESFYDPSWTILHWPSKKKSSRGRFTLRNILEICSWLDLRCTRMTQGFGCEALHSEDFGGRKGIATPVMYAARKARDLATFPEQDW